MHGSSKALPMTGALSYTPLPPCTPHLQDACLPAFVEWGVCSEMQTMEGAYAWCGAPRGFSSYISGCVGMGFGWTGLIPLPLASCEILSGLS